MQGHELRAIFPGFALGLAGFERSMREKCGEFGEFCLDIFRRALETAGHIDEFVEVLYTRLRAAARVGFVKVAQTAALDRVVDLLSQRQRVAVRHAGFRQLVNQGEKRLQSILRATGEASACVFMQRRIP